MQHACISWPELRDCWALRRSSKILLHWRTYKHSQTPFLFFLKKGWRNCQANTTQSCWSVHSSPHKSYNGECSILSCRLLSDHSNEVPIYIFFAGKPAALNGAAGKESSRKSRQEDWEDEKPAALQAPRTLWKPCLKCSKEREASGCCTTEVEAKTLGDAWVQVRHSAQSHHPNNKHKTNVYCSCLLTCHCSYTTYIPLKVNVG